MKDIEAIILAGGRGSRMGDLTNEAQKCLLPIDDKPVLGQIIDVLSDNFGKINYKIAVSYKADQVIDFVNKNTPKKSSVSYIPHALGTEGWVIYTDMEKHIQGPFIAMPGDILALPNAYTDVVDIFSANDVVAAMTLSPDLEAIDTHGVGIVKDSKVRDLLWPPPIDLKEDHLRDMTIWSSDKNFFKIIQEYPSPRQSIGVLFMKVVQDKKPIAGNIYNNPWIHLGYPEDLKKSIQNI